MTFVLFLLFSLSASINIILVWYVRRIIREIVPLHENAGVMLEELEDFCEHVEGITELPVFYGDPTIKGLLQYSRAAADSIRVYREGFIFENEKEIQFEEAETEEE